MIYSIQLFTKFVQNLKVSKLIFESALKETRSGYFWPLQTHFLHSQEFSSSASSIIKSSDNWFSFLVSADQLASDVWPSRHVGNYSFHITRKSNSVQVLTFDFHFIKLVLSLWFQLIKELDFHATENFDMSYMSIQNQTWVPVYHLEDVPIISFMTSKDMASIKIGFLQNKSLWLKEQIASKIIFWNDKKIFD